uniref:Battenin n=2 Tax=Parascaris univalens TaxID=6257 RepID=A0A915C519_PARUN
MNRRWLNVRVLTAFWIIGLCNNYAYVIMLSAAEDILSQQEHLNITNTEKGCEETLTSRHCTTISTGAVLLADILPTLVVKMTFPLFMQRIPFGIRHLFVCVLQATSYLMVAFSVSIPMSLVGVIFASLGSGLGEITYLSLTPFFGRNAISAWSSGTGGAGVIGALSYAGLTEPKLANLSPKAALLVMLVVPVIFASAYWLLLSIPESVYQVKVFDPRSWIVPSSHLLRRKSVVIDQAVDEAMTNDAWKFESGAEVEKAAKGDKKRKMRSYSSTVTDGTLKQRQLSLTEKLLTIIPLLKFMIPLMLVYLGEYLINQGIVQLIIFKCADGFGLSRSSQYRWYQVLYQVGVFISRSSINLIRLPYSILVLLPILQLLNAVLFFLDALYFFIPHIGIIFTLILFEGLFGGSSYVNTFDRIHNYVAPDVREYALSVGSLGDSVGIVIAGFTSIPLHNYVCETPLPSN